MEAHGVSVDRSYYKNSAYDVAELHVENHKFCTPFRGNVTLRKMERLLQRLIIEGPLTPLGEYRFAGTAVTFLGLVPDGAFIFSFPS